MSKKRDIVKNYSYYMIYQIISIVLPIFTTPYLTRVLGAEALGIYGYTLSIITYFVMFSALGISRYGQREIAYVQNDRYHKSKIFWELNVIRLITTIISTLIFIIFFCLNGDYYIFYRILILELISVTLDIAWFFQGEENFKKIAIRNSFVKIISMILIFILVKQPDDLEIYFWIYVVSNCLSNASLWFKIRKHVDFVKIDFKNLNRHVKPMIILLIPQVAISIYTVLDKTMLGIILDDISEVGYYEQAQKIIRIALAFVTNLSAVMVPRISSIYASGNEKLVNEYMKKSFRFNWLLGLPIVLGLIAISSKFVPWFFGKGYEDVIMLIIFCSPIVILTAFSTTIGEQYLISIKKQNVYTYCVLLCAIINIVLNYVLINFFGTIGAVISTVLAELVLLIVEIIYITSKQSLKLSFVFDGFFRYLTSSIVMFACIMLTSNLFPIGFIYTCIEILLGIIVYGIAIILFKDNFVISIIKKLLKR